MVVCWEDRNPGMWAIGAVGLVLGLTPRALLGQSLFPGSWFLALRFPNTAVDFENYVGTNLIGYYTETFC